MAKPAPDQRRQRNRHLLLGALATSVGLALITSFDWLGQAGPVLIENPEVDEVAQRDIRAPEDMTIVDAEATQREREIARQGSAVVYYYDPNRATQVRERVRAAFAAAAAASQPSQAPAEDAMTPAEAFRMALGQGEEISDASLVMLLSDQYAVSPRDELLSVLGPILGRKIIDDRTQLDRYVEQKRPIQLIEKGSDAPAPPLVNPKQSVMTVTEAIAAAKLAIDKRLTDSPRALRNSLFELARSLIGSNLSFDQRLTDERQQRAAESVPEVTIALRKGEIVVRSGDRLGARSILLIQGIQAQVEQRRDFAPVLGAFVLMFGLLTATWRFASNGISRFPKEVKDAAFLMTTLVGTALATKVGLLICESVAAYPDFAARVTDQPEYLYYALPIAAASMLVRVVHNAETAVVFAVILAVVSGLQIGGDVSFPAYVLVGSLVAALAATHVSQRGTLLRGGVRVGSANAATAAAIVLLQNELAVMPLLVSMVAGFIGGVLSGGLVSALAPVVETLFGYTTDVKLLELANREQPLLRELEVHAPGTYHHSMMVGHLAEKAAEAIGANALLAKVAGYYHDIGKMRRPHFFVENITIHQGQNRHEKLAPSMSARIIQAHVKDGLEMGEKNHLAPAIMRGIGEHHGTSVIRFFYEKAKELADKEKGEVVQEHDYRYPGPKPQTREAGILMLADSVEAASRTLADTSPARIQQLVQRIINNYFRDGQLDECSLTLRDLHAIARSLIDTLSAIRHERIDYPEATGPDGKAAGKGTDEGVVERLEPRAKDRSERASAERSDDLKRLGLP